MGCADYMNNGNLWHHQGQIRWNIASCGKLSADDEQTLRYYSRGYMAAWNQVLEY